VFGASLESEQSRGYCPGHVLANRYELKRLLGEGGTGVVWAAHDRVLNLEVAVKLVRQQGEAAGDFARRARIEARSAAKIAHPAVCRAMDFGLSAYGEPYIVSELLVGESLDEAIARQGRLEATHAVRLLLPILDALGAAHEGGIVHRDVKPANIFLACDGLRRHQPKLLDFGIACWLDDPGSMSDTGICGTPEFMSPEQARGSEDIDGRSDLWNFCATLYEALTGVVPFREESPAAVLCAIQTVAPDPVTTFCAGDERLSAIILRGMSRDRDDRWQSARELAHQLCLWLLDQGIETDICDHSLRARLLGGGGPDSGRDSPYAHVLPGNDTRARAARDGERTVSGRGGSWWRRPWVAVAAGAALVAATSSFQALRADDQRRAAALAPHATSLPQTETNDAPAPAPGSPSASTRTSTGDGLESVSAQAPLAARQGSFISGAPTRTPRVVAVTSEGARTPGAATVPSPPAPQRRARNALNYDFGF
jgi:eukaryotic-like serine/threonine-protein kinase